MDEHQIANAPQGPGYIVLEEARKVRRQIAGRLCPNAHARFARVIAWIAVHIWTHGSQVAAVPITAYFVITAHTARRTSYEYLTRVRGRSARVWHVFRHFHCFSATILDRVYLLRVSSSGSRHSSRKKAWTAMLKAAEAAYC